ncbi:MAG: cysteine synthase A [Rhodospirillales bacterium]|nr:cysteine synthase A [Rhodospirillales bacterium]
MAIIESYHKNSSTVVGRGGVYDDITQTIGNTPLVRLSRLAAAYEVKGEILAKVESFNPAGSVKDRAAFTMIEKMELEGKIGPDTELIEATSGNCGVAVAWVCAMKEIPLTIVMPEHMSVERRKMQALFGAKLVLTPKELGTKGAIDKANQLVERYSHMQMLGQFSNSSNTSAHRNGTAEEIWTDTHGKVDVIVAGVGTGGTISGLAEALKAKNSNLRVVAVEPASCPVLSGGRSGVHKIQGLSSGHVPDILRTDLIDEIITVENQDAIAMARIVARKEAIAVGISSGAAAIASLEVAKRSEMDGKTIVTIFADFAERYISTDVFAGM